MAKEQFPHRAVPIERQQGTTSAERYLARLCEKSFLSLWSYPGVYRNQGNKNGGDGKELADLLVVFDRDVLIFSDKDCKFPDSGKLDCDWGRWFRAAVQKSAEQVWGAERWVRRYPNRLYLDRKCTRQFPVVLPAANDIRIHRIVVAHNAAKRCAEILGGSGSLMLFPALKGAAHFNGPPPVIEGPDGEGWIADWKKRSTSEGKVMPFTIGDIDPAKGFVHVFDDTSLEVVMSTLDTIADFVKYLTLKEDFIRSGRLFYAAGEDDLLAHYLQNRNGDGKPSFFVPPNEGDSVILVEGEWEKLKNSPEWLSRTKANRVSYLWDFLIERFSGHIRDGTSLAYPDFAFGDQEVAVRALAKENRFHRRMLGYALNTFLSKPSKGFLTARVVKPVGRGSPHYIFLTVRPDGTESRETYREHRRAIMSMYALAAKKRFSEVKSVVVIATEPQDFREFSSHDVCIAELDRDLTAEEVAMAQEIESKCGFLTKIGEPFHAKAFEYPPDQANKPTENRPVNKSGSLRNQSCPCGSGRKFKHCCIHRT